MYKKLSDRRVTGATLPVMRRDGHKPVTVNIIKGGFSQMKITIFAKIRATTDEKGKAKNFTTFLAKLKTKTGEEKTVTVKFPDEIKPKADECPMNIIFDKQNANLAIREYINEETGETGQSRTLWVKSYIVGEPYVDHSLDDFEE